MTIHGTVHVQWKSGEVSDYSDIGYSVEISGLIIIYHADKSRTYISPSAYDVAATTESK